MKNKLLHIFSNSIGVSVNRVQYPSFWKLCAYLLATVSLLAFAGDACAQIVLLRPRQDTNYTTTWVGSNRHIHLEAQNMYFGDTPETWQALFTSGYVTGFSGQKLTRGIDAVENWHYNFANPAKFNPDATGGQLYYWAAFADAGTPSSTYTWATKFKVGSRAGQLLFNEDVIAAGGEQLILYNHNNTVSRYSMDGNSYTDYAWTTLTGGNFDGMLLGDALKFMIGYEEDGTASLYFIDDNDFILAYNLSTGTIVASYSMQFQFDAVAKGYLGNDVKLVDIIDGKVDGWSYLGWDVGPILVSVDGIIIPEPSEIAAIVGLAVLGFALRRRKK